MGSRSARISVAPVLLLVASLTGLTATRAAGTSATPGVDSTWTYTAPFFTSSSYDPGVPRPDSILGFEIGSRPVQHEDLWRYFDALARSSARVRIEEDGGRTYEERRLAHLIITSPENQARLSEIRRDVGRIADPRLGGAGEAKGLIDRTPAVCWLGCSIHGDELSGVDASVVLAYELAASRDSSVQRLLRDLVVIIDPCQNPDGRARFLATTTQWKSAVPNPDYRALDHAGVWPWGRGNHYLFDLNRDWLAITQPETRDRVRTLVAWNPQLVVDIHEMSGLDTYLFSPPREPFNPNLSAFNRKWGDLFARDQAAAFDRHGWSYYSGEWNEEWYPGFGSSRARYTGAVGILYEEAGVQGSLVKQADGIVLTYRETVHHQFVSALANLTTAANHRADLLSGFLQERARAIALGLTGPVRAFYILPGKTEDRAARLARLLIDQGIEVGRLGRDTPVGDLHDIWGEKSISKTLPRGTYVVSLAQPMGGLARAFLEFDPRMDRAFLESERRELEARSESRLYEVTAWSLPMAFGIDAYWSGGATASDVQPIERISEAPGAVEDAGARYGYLIDGAPDASLRALSILLQSGAQVRVAMKAFGIEGREYPRGSILLRRHDNGGDLDQVVARAAHESGVTVRGVSTAKSDVPPDLGGEEFRLLTEPKIAILAGPPLDFTSFGAVWWLLDRELALRASPIDLNTLGDADLSKYNVLVFPSCWGGPENAKRVLGDVGTTKIRTWIEGGGTLITLGDASAFVADSTAKLSQVRERGQALPEMESYKRDFEREAAAREPKVDSLAVWDGPPIKGSPVPAGKEGTLAQQRPAPKEGTAAVAGEGKTGAGDLRVLEEEDRRARLFKPQGTILRADLDRESWLTAGLPDRLPVLVASGSAFLSRRPVETVARLAPPESIRLSGLLWPEARERWANTAYLTRETRGKGQIILFLGEPHFRAQFVGSERLLENALLMGPGLGVRRALPW